MTLRDFFDRFETHTASVTYTPLPEVTNDDGFLVSQDADGFVGSIGLAEARTFLEPPIYRLQEETFVGTTYQAPLEILDDTLWHSLDPRQLVNGYKFTVIGYYRQYVD